MMSPQDHRDTLRARAPRTSDDLYSEAVNDVLGGRAQWRVSQSSRQEVKASSFLRVRGE